MPCDQFFSSLLEVLVEQMWFRCEAELEDYVEPHIAINNQVPADSV
jgi:hypothetical protein